MSKITTGKVRLSYANVWTPKETEGGDLKYTACLIIPKADTATIEKIEAIVEDLKKEALTHYKGKLPKDFNFPLRDGDERDDADSNFADSYYLNCSTKQKPTIVSLEKDEDGKFKRITDESAVYSGCYVRASINFFFYTKGKGGISVGLNNIQKLADGDKLAGASKPEDDFSEEFEMDDELL